MKGQIDVSQAELAVLAEAIAELTDRVGSLTECVRAQPVAEDDGRALARAVRLAELRGVSGKPREATR